MKGSIQIIVKFRTEKNLCVFLSANVFLRGIKYWLRKQLSSFEKERLISYSYTIWFIISEQNMTRCLFLHCGGACMYQKCHRCIQKMWTSGVFYEHGYILTKGGWSFKTFLKKNYASAFWTLLKNVKHWLGHDIDKT